MNALVTKLETKPTVSEVTAVNVERNGDRLKYTADIFLVSCGAINSAYRITVPMNDVDRVITDSEDEGFVKIHVRAGTDKILGATIVARHAGEMINEISLSMLAKIGLKTIGEVIHSYPTQAEAIRRAADAYNKTRLTPLFKRLTTRWLSWTR